MHQWLQEGKLSTLFDMLYFIKNGLFVKKYITCSGPPSSYGCRCGVDIDERSARVIFRRLALKFCISTVKFEDAWREWYAITLQKRAKQFRKFSYVFIRSSYYVYINFMILFRRNGWATYKVLKHFQFVIWESYFTSRLTMLGLML